MDDEKVSVWELEKHVVLRRDGEAVARLVDAFRAYRLEARELLARCGRGESVTASLHAFETAISAIESKS